MDGQQDRKPVEAAAFTPGPWYPVTGQGAHHRDIYIRAGERRADGTWPAVAKCCSSGVGTHVTVQQNGRLIAAAPDLYEALADVAMLADQHAERYPGDRDAVALAARVRAALAKAGGA